MLTAAAFDDDGDADAFGSELAVRAGGQRGRNSDLYAVSSEEELRSGGRQLGSSSPSAASAASESRLQGFRASGDGAHPDSASMNLLRCLFAMAFAALTLGLLTCVGLVVQTSGACAPQEGGYSRCAMWQDLRSMLSFLLGAALCGLFTRGKEAAATAFYAPERAEKVQLYAYML